MISSGCICTCWQTGAQLWVVRSAAPNGRWHLVGKRTDSARPQEIYQPRRRRGRSRRDLRGEDLWGRRRGRAPR